MGREKKVSPASSAAALVFLQKTEELRRTAELAGERAGLVMVKAPLQQAWNEKVGPKVEEMLKGFPEDSQDLPDELTTFIENEAKAHFDEAVARLSSLSTNAANRRAAEQFKKKSPTTSHKKRNR